MADVGVLPEYEGALIALVSTIVSDRALQNADMQEVPRLSRPSLLLVLYCKA